MLLLIHALLAHRVQTYRPHDCSNSSHYVQWCHYGHDGVSNHQPHHCLPNRLFRRRWTSKLRVTGLCAGNSRATSDFPAQMVCNAENVSIWWRHHAGNHLILKMLFSSTFPLSMLWVFAAKWPFYEAGPHWSEFNIVTGNGLVTSGNNPLPEPIMTHNVAIWHQKATLS